MSHRFPLTWFLLTLLLIISGYLYFYHLGSSSLVSWDEAWYASIAHNILTSQNPFQLTFNGTRFADHPPAGFWFIALSQLFFGVTEFGSRAASAISALLTLLFVFLLGRKLFHPLVGLTSAFALSTSPWFVYRARSGNLDIFLTLLFVTTIYFAFQVRSSPRFRPAFILSLALLFLTKTLVPFTVIPALLVIFSSQFLQLFSLVGLGLLLTFPWFGLQFLTYPSYLSRIFSIGTPGSSIRLSFSNYYLNFRQILSYLHFSLEAWFRPVVAAAFFSLFFGQKRFLVLLVFIISFFLPFISSNRGQIWHLIPLHPFLLLSFCGFVYVFFIRFSSRLAAAFLLTVVLYLGLPQAFRNWYAFINIPAYVSDEAILSRVAARYPYPLIIDDNFVPAAVFYSGKTVTWLNTPNFADLASQSRTLIITKQSRADAFRDLFTYQYLASDRDKVLLLTP